MDNQPATIREMALFAGAGGGILGGHLLGWKTVCAVEWEPYPACVLVARQNDKILPPFPIWDDVQTFDGKPWRGLVDVVSGGFPCQDISSAGRGAGIDGERSGMWREMARIVGEVRPRLVFVENSPMLVGRGAALVISDLAKMGYDCQWCIVSASDCGAPHQRDRFWLLAHTNDYEYCANGKQKGKEDGIQGECGQEGLARQPCRTSYDTEILAYASQLQRNGGNDNAGELMGSGQVPESGNDCRSEHVADTICSQKYQIRRIDKQRRNFMGWHEQTTQQKNWETSSNSISRCSNEVADTNSTQCKRNQCAQRSEQKRANTSQSSWWASEPDVGRVADGVAARVDRLKAIGNGQVPIVAATAFSILRGR